MSYKDEYEVARLFTNGDFERQISQTFDGDFKMKFHLAPPLINFGKKPNGRPRKREFGAWMMPLFRTLAKMKSLRGGAFDIFGYSAERKQERALIAEYRAMIEEILLKLDESNRVHAQELAQIPNDIRGFGPVKEKSIIQANKKKQELLERFLQAGHKVKSEKSPETA